MECESSYATGFLKYLKDFVANIRPDDPLPVRAPSYKVTESEIDGQILDIVHHYLNSRECPPYVREYVGHKVWTEIRHPGVNGDGMEDEIDGPNTTTNHNYDAMKLIQEVTGKANTVMREMANKLTVDEVERFPRYLPISHFAIKNTRRKMEDRHVIIHDLNTLYGLKYESPHAYYGVFDGHAGTDAAVYSAAHLHQYMIQNPQYETHPEAALKHAFHITDTNFIKKVSKERLKGGTTAVVALIREKRLVVAWLGDSQALLVRRRNPVRMVEPHKPELPVERERVEELGGCVINIQGTWRVLGQLAVSRAIGDADYKPYVSSECDIKSLEIEGDEDFLILACDGLWDTLSPEGAVSVVYAYLTHNNGETDGVGRCLVDAARSTGSEDNITAVVVFLRPVATLMEEEAQRIAQGQVPDTVPAVVMEKDSTPSSINAIFSPPVFSPPINQFELSQDTSPKLFNPDDFSFDMNSHNDAQNAFTPTSEPSPIKDKDEPMEASEAPVMPPHDSDSDEGFPVGAEGAPDSQAFNPHDAPTPTAEEVDAALAELDSIPDGVCESGEVEEEEEDEEEWSYFRMEPQTQPQGEDVLVGGIPSAAAVPPTEDTSVLPEQSAMVQDQDIVQVPEIPTKDQTEDQACFDEKSVDFIGNLSEKQSKNELLDIFEKEKDLGPAPMEADEAHVVVGKIPDIMQSSMDMIPSLDDHPEKLIKFSEPETEKTNDLVEASFEPSSPHGSGSPHAPGSPRSVEGFVTSVELNTPDESFSTNFTVNQTQDIFAGVVDQTSGPFSVYVSSSPEPASLDPPAQAAVDLLNMSGEMTNGQVDEEHATINQTPQPCEESPVEIVHAQSTVEVVAPPSPVNVSGPETQFIIPDQVPNSPTSAQLPPTDISFVPQPVMEPMPEVPIPVYVDDTPVSEPDFIPGVEQSVTESAFESIVDVAENTDEVALEPKMQVDTSVSVSNSELLMETSHLQTSETHTQMESATEVASRVESAAETFSVVESAAETFSQVESTAETFSQVESTAETLSQVESTAETLSQVESTAETLSQVESTAETLSQVESTAETLSQVESTAKTLSQVESAAETLSHVESAAETHTLVETTAETFSHEESAAETVSIMESTIEIKPNEMSPTPLSPALSPIEAPPVIAPVEASPVPTDLETEPAVLPSVEKDHVTSSPAEAEVVSAPVNDIPEETLKLAKSPELVDVKSPSKTKKTPAKAATDKAPPKMTPGKATPSRATPGKATPTRTPSTKTPSTRTPTPRTPITKSTEKKTPIAKQTTPASTSKPAAAKPTTKPTTTKPTSARPAAPKLAPTTRPAPTKTTATRAPLSTSRTAERPTKPAGSTAPKPPSSRPSGPAAKPTTTRPTPAARTSAPATRKPTTTTKSTDKTDGSKLVNGTTSRPSSRPTTGKSTLSTTARKPLASSAARATAKTAAEKETKNTTNQILSTNRPSKTASPSTRTTTTKTSAHSTSRTMSKGIESTNTAKSRLTTSSVKSTAKTTGAATKKTLIKSKSAQTGAKETPKTKTEAAVIDKTEPLVNGENKIADEETSVEVIEKSAVEDIMQASTEKIISETITSSEQVIVTTETTDVLVNGDH